MTTSTLSNTTGNTTTSTRPRTRLGGTISSTITFTRYELVRTLRNRQFFFFTLAFPLVMYLVLGGSQDGDVAPGVPLAAYLMVGMAGWGAMMAVLAGGSRISAERSIGWVRALRLTPLSTTGYVTAKVATSYVIALLSLAALYIAGTVLGVRLDAAQWLSMTGLILVALVPLAVLGILIGHLVSPDSLGPTMGGVGALLAFLGGAWFPVAGWLHTIGQYLPSYWLTQAGQAAMAHHGWPLQGWLVVGGWTVGLAVLAAAAYRRGSQRA